MPHTQPVPDFVLRHTGFALGIVGEMSKQLYLDAIAPLGINERQLYILTALEHLGPQVQAHLSIPLRIDKALLVGLVNDLERKGLAQRRPHPEDRRAVLVQNTEAGHLLVQRAEAISNDFTQKFFAGLSPEERAILDRVLAHLATNAVTLGRGKDTADNSEDMTPA